jgi:uncharacterized membrane protein
MTITAVTSYDISLFLHITAVVVGLGSTFALAITFPIAQQLDVRHLPYVHRLSIALNQYFAAPGLLVVIATGFYQVADRDWQLGDFWLSGTITIVVVLLALIFGYFLPTDRKLGAMVAQELAGAGSGEVVLSEEYQRRSRIEGLVGAITGLLLVAAIYLMVIKPGL